MGGFIEGLTDLQIAAIEYSHTSPAQLAVPIEDVVATLPVDELVPTLYKSLLIEPRYAYAGSLSLWKNRRRVAGIAAMSAGRLKIEWGQNRGDINFAHLELPSQFIDFPILEEIISGIVECNDLNDAEFATYIDWIEEKFAETLIGRRLADIWKSGKSSNVFAHMIDYLRKVRTDGLPARDRLVLRISFLHDIAKVLFKPPFAKNPKNDEFVALLGIDRLEDHGLLSGLYFSGLWRHVLQTWAAEGKKPAHAELLDEETHYLVTRVFRLHQISAHLDRATQDLPGLTPQDVHELFGGNVEAEMHVLSLVTAMTAFDSSSVAEHSGYAEHAKFEGINPIFVYNLVRSVVAQIEVKREEIEKSLSYLQSIVAQNIEQSIARLMSAGEVAVATLNELIQFITSKAPEFSPAFITQLASAS